MNRPSELSYPSDPNRRNPIAMPEKLSESQFLFVREWLRFHLGQDLSADKAYFAEVALSEIRDRFRFHSLGETVRRLEIAAPMTNRWRCTLDDSASNPPERKLVQDTFDALMVGETYFFRRPSTFEDLREKVLPALIRKRAAERRLNIWCAACSSGQEPYSLAMLLSSEFPDVASLWDLRILATDVCAQSLKKAMHGTYSDWEVARGVESTRFGRFFEPAARPGFRRIVEPVRRMINWRMHNLVEDFWELPGQPFDLVLMRNVLIYFDIEAKSRILKSVRLVIADDGALLLGESETLLGLDVPFSISDSVPALGVPR